MTVISTAKSPRPLNAEPDEAAINPPKVEAPLDIVDWEVVRNAEDAPAVRPITRADSKSNAQVEGQEISFRTTAADPRRHRHQDLSDLEGGGRVRRRAEVLGPLEGRRVEVHL